MKTIRTVITDEDDNVISMAETEVDSIEDIERHLENWHSLKSSFKRHEKIEEEQAKDAEELLDLTEPH